MGPRMADPNIGFIGLGNVGSQLAGNLLRHGVNLTVRDIDPQRVAPLLARGARSAVSPRALAAAVDIVITCLPSPAVCAAVMEAHDGVLAGLRVHRVTGVAVRDEDVVLTLHPPDVRDQSPVDLLARESGDRDELAALDRLAQVPAELLAAHAGGARRGDAEHAQREHERRSDQARAKSVPPSCHWPIESAGDRWS